MRNQKLDTLRAAILNRYYTAMLQAAIMGLKEFVGFEDQQIEEMVDEMLQQIQECKEDLDSKLIDLRLLG